MKKLFLIIVIILPTLIKAQQYVPFPDSNVSWNEFNYGQGDPSLKYTYFIQGDTNINSQLYHKIYSVDSSSIFYKGGLSEYNKKIYFIDKNCSHDILLYNFNLTIGDSIKSSCHLCDTIMSVYMKVVTIDSVLLTDMTYRKKINFDWGPVYSWIEGIGSVFGLLYPENTCSACSCWTELVCFNHNDTTLYLNEDNVSCFDYVVSINELKKKSNLFNVYPNPVAKNLTIETPQKAVIEIINIQGQFIKSLAAGGNKTSIDVSDFPSGVYVVKVKTEKGVTMKKFVKE